MTDNPIPSHRFRLAGPESDRSSTATLNLCTRSYLDPDFRDYVLNELYERSDRALAPDPGIHRGRVVRDARHARVVNAVAMAAIYTAGIIVTLLQPLADLLVLIAVCIWWLAAACVVQRLFAKSSLRMESYAAGDLLLGPRRLLATVALGWVLFGAGWWLGGDRKLGPLAVQLAILGALSAMCGAYRGYRISRIPKGKVPPGFSTSLLARIEDTSRAEVVTHRSDTLAFVGFGKPGQRRRIILSLDAPACGRPAQLIDLEILVKDFRSRIEAHAEESDSETDHGAPQLELHEHVFVADSAVSELTYWVKDLHVGGRTFASMAEIRSAPMHAVQPYLRIQVSQGGGELVTTVFVHFVMQAETLTIEFVPYHLLPTEARFRLFGNGRARVGPLVAWAGISGFAAMPLIAFQAPWSALKTLIRWGARWTRPRLRRLRLSSGGFGADTGIRQRSCDRPENHPNEENESDRMSMVLMHLCMKALRDHLGDKVDVTPLDHDMKHAVQYNITGNEVSIAAVGEGAQANVGAIGNRSHGALRWLSERLKR